MIDLKALLSTAVKYAASDIHLKAGAVPTIRVRGELMPLGAFPQVTKKDTLDLAHHLLNTRQKEVLADKSEIDLSFGGTGIGRFRLAVFQQRGTISLVFRLIPDRVPSMEELHLPVVLEDIAESRRGLILVTGATGSGKSTSLSAMLQHINASRRTHILTIEDPIEFLLTDQLALITQREVNTDTTSFSSALRAALRQDPDVIMVGEMRDQETVLTAMQAAETGHLVMSTLHTADAAETITRVISMFPPGLQGDVRFRLATCLRAIVSMRLIKSSVDSQRYPAVEVLRNTELVRSLIEQREKTKDLRGAMETGFSQYGMQTFDQSLFKLYKDGLISADDALAQASYPEDLRLKLQGIVGSAEKL